MGPSKPSITISQQAFDEMVKENIDDLEMDPTEALQDAIQTLTLQGVDLSGIVTCKEDPVIRSLDRLKQLNSDWVDRKDVDEVVGLLDELTGLCLVEGSRNAAIGTRNGGIELVCSVCSELHGGAAWGLDSGLKALASLLHDVQSRDTFQRSGGPKMVMAILSDSNQSSNVVNGSFSVVAAAATANEIVKESFMDLKIDELMLQILRTRDKGSIHSLYDAIRVLLTPDDNRVVASQVYGYARQFAKIGIAEVLVDSLKEGLNSPSLVSATIALKAVAVNDEICRSIAETGGVDAVLRCIDDSGVQGNKNVARVCCSLLCKLAGSDANKSAIVQKGGMDRLIKLAARFSDDPSVLQEVMSIISVLSLRAPDNAARAIEAGAGDLAIQAMQSFPGAHQMQRNACSMIRNLAVRNPENRTILLNNGIEKLVRKARENHESCNSAATDALRDLGLDDYNK